MRKLFVLSLFIVLVACNEIVPRPKVLVDEKTMSQLIADLAIDDQLMIIDAGLQSSEQAAYTLKKSKVNINDFKESYSYYVATKKIDKILENAQDIVLNKDTKAKEYIEKRNKENESSLQKETLQLNN